MCATVYFGHSGSPAEYRATGRANGEKNGCPQLLLLRLLSNSPFVLLSQLFRTRWREHLSYPTVIRFHRSSFIYAYTLWERAKYIIDSLLVVSHVSFSWDVYKPRLSRLKTAQQIIEPGDTPSRGSGDLLHDYHCY